MRRLLLLITSGLIYLSCSEQVKSNTQIEKYGLGWDSVRQIIGLPLIHGNLILNNTGYECLDVFTDCAMYVNLDTALKPRFDRKHIYWDSAGISLERNYFIGPQDEILQVYYGYKKFSDWTRIGFGYGFRHPNKGLLDPFTKEQADSVLLSWEIKF